MANFTPDYYANTYSFEGDVNAKAGKNFPKKSTLNFILSYSKSIEFVGTKSNSKSLVEVNLN